MRYRRIEWIDPIEAAGRLVGLPGLALLDSAMAHPTLGRFSYLAADPFGRFVVRDGVASWNGVAEAGAPLDALRARLAACRCERVPGLPPFQGGAIGAFAYELGWLLEGRPLPPAGRGQGWGSRCPSWPAEKHDTTPTPGPSPQGGGESVGPACRGDDLHLAFHDVIVAFDHEEHACWLIASGLPAGTRADRAEARLAAFAAHLEGGVLGAGRELRPSDPDERITLTGHARPCAGHPRRAAATISVDDVQCPGVGGRDKPGHDEDWPSPRGPGEHIDLVWQQMTSRDAYRAAVERVREYIRAGDIYQANIAQRFVAALPDGVEPWLLYKILRDRNPAPFAAYLDCGARKILSTSPELFLRTDGCRVETRPIKGTARRDPDPTADRAAGAALLASRKDRAENVMIVDLLRNDLSKVCTPESVDVPTLCGLESYSGLHHLVSSVTGELRAGADALDLLAACFPGGSITGAPKLRAMEIIAEIEGVSRGLYCGAIGALGFSGDMVLNIAIRTLVIDGGTIELAAGGGITMLSDPDQEYEETLTKARRILEAFAGAPEPAPTSIWAGA